MRLFPAFHDLRGRTAVIVGGTAATVGKARLLLAAGAAVTVVAPVPAAAIAAWSEAGRLTVRRRALRARDLAAAALVVIATGDPASDAEAAALARAASVPVNVIDRPDLSDFQVPAIVDRDPVVVAISTGGAAPALARWLRRRIEAALPAGLIRLVEFAKRIRVPLATAVTDTERRRRLWDSVLDGPIGVLALAGREGEALERLSVQLERSAPRGGEGIVHIVGAGPGDPDLLTLKAHRLLHQADVIVYDRLVGAGVLELARREAERIDVGKTRGRHRFSQAQINALLVRLARQGKRVVRLKGGDPFVFGRGGEELAYLIANGVAAEVVPGITAALAAGAGAGIPLTHRGIASAVTLLTGHGLDGVDWAGVARCKQTLAIYMGRENAGDIAGLLVAAGLAPATPAAIVENATLPSERRFNGSLAQLGDIVADNHIEGPALILIGEVAGAAAQSAAVDLKAAS